MKEGRKDVFYLTMHSTHFIYFSLQPVLQDWCNKGCGMCYPVCGMVHIKEPLLLIDKSSHSKSRKEGNVIFNALNTFYLRLYGVRHMVKDHCDSEKRNPLLQHRLLLLTARVISYAPSHRQDNTYHSLCYTSRGELAGMRNSSMDHAIRIIMKEGRLCFI